MSTKRSHILKENLKAAGFFMYLWCFSGYQALKGEEKSELGGVYILLGLYYDVANLRARDLPSYVQMYW